MGTHSIRCKTKRKIPGWMERGEPLRSKQTLLKQECHTYQSKVIQTRQSSKKGRSKSLKDRCPMPQRKYLSKRDISIMAYQWPSSSVSSHQNALWVATRNAIIAESHQQSCSSPTSVLFGQYTIITPLFRCISKGCGLVGEPSLPKLKFTLDVRRYEDRSLHDKLQTQPVG